MRGRDSAGLHVFVWGHDIEPDGARRDARRARRRPAVPVDARSSTATAVLSFVYKAAAEIGELGDNTAALRAALVDDRLLRRAIESPVSRVAVLGHTRWASVGIISEPNTHPLNSIEMEQPAGAEPPYVVAALNGDVDNHADLRAAHGLRIAAPITTDAKVIPTLVSRHLATGVDPIEAFRRTVSAFEGSVAIGMASADPPGTLFLALRGSGQGMYVGLADDCTIVASEPYGVVEETSAYVRMDGEQGGEIVVVSRRRRRHPRRASSGSATTEPPCPVSADDVVTAEVTTRDINRGDAPHFLLKEISEAPVSFAKTLRGKIVEHDGGCVAGGRRRGAPPRHRGPTRRRHRSPRIRVIGQGTAAVAGQSTAAHPRRVDARPARRRRDHRHRAVRASACVST